MAVNRLQVNLSAYPDLVVIYLGMRVNKLYGLKTLIALRPGILASVEAHPDGLLLHEDLVYSIFPTHIGMRQYWRDFESLERWARSEPHRIWRQPTLPAVPGRRRQCGLHCASAPKTHGADRTGRFHLR